MRSIDKTVLADYDAGIEFGRLRSGVGRIEFDYTKELLLKNLPKPPAVIYDIGGAYGEYSWWLASLGYEVHLFDLSEKNIMMSEMLRDEYPGTELASREVCDARSVPRKDATADAVLLMGPLYHILDREDRLTAIRESRRLLKPEGLLFAGALTPFSVLLHNITVYEPNVEGGKRRLEDPIFLNMVKRELTDGHHDNPGHIAYAGIGSSHLHTAKELREELKLGGFEETEVNGVMGGAWLDKDLDSLWENESSREALMNTIRLLDGHEEILGLSGHLLGISVK